MFLFRNNGFGTIRNQFVNEEFFNSYGVKEFIEHRIESGVMTFLLYESKDENYKRKKFAPMKIAYIKEKKKEK